MGVFGRDCRRGMSGGGGQCLTFAIALLLLLAVCGCKDEKDKSEGRATTQAAAEEEGHYLGAGSVKPAVSVARAPATRPTGPLAKGASCVTAECHATYATAAHIHGPVASGACDSCHGADSGGHRYPLKRGPVETCTFCHTVSGTMKYQHQALQQGCTSCHRPHESSAKFLLKADTVERTCALCHDVPLKKFAHDPFARGQCTLCHQSHQAETKMLLRGGEGPNHCYQCHADVKQAMAGSAHTHKPATEQCVTCHSPHAAENPMQLLKPMDQGCLACHDKVAKQVKEASVPHGAMLADKQCANCHNGHASNQPNLLKQRMGQMCLTCHDRAVKGTDGRMIAGVKEQITEAKFLHGPVRSGDCSACHEAHGGKNVDLLVKAFPKSFYAPFKIDDYALCFSCHEKQLVLSKTTEALTNFRDGTRNLHYVHVHRDDKGRTCRTCHEVHGSNLPRHMASSVPFEGSNWAMPIQYETTVEGGRCAPGCHVPQEYRRIMPATQPTTRGVK